MKRENIFLTLLMFAIFFIAIQGCSAQRKTAKSPLIWNVEELDSERSVSKSKLTKSLRSLGESHRAESLVVVTDKKNAFAPDKHYYCSMGPYWWPDPENPGKYINKDGYINPERSQYDREKLSFLTKKCNNLSRAFYLTADTVFYNTFVKQLQVWFVNKETYMYPNFEYAQVIPGQRDNKGRSTGLIDAYDFNSIIESVRLVNSAKKIDMMTMEALQSWFLEFAKWADTQYFVFFHDVNNNISLAFDVTMANIYLFAGKEKRAKEIVDKFAELRIEKQILEDGSQPSELKRTQAFSYSMFNLTHIIDMCYLARYWYPNYYLEHRERIDKAFEFLGKYVDNPESFPYQQISSWEKCKRNYLQQLDRVEKLKTNGNNWMVTHIRSTSR